MTSGKIEICIAQPEDNQDILELSRKCPMEADITVYPDRSPVYDAIQKTIDKDSYLSIGKHDGKVIGCLGCTYFDFQINKKLITGGIIADFKVDPDFRKSLATYRIVKNIAETEKNTKASFLIGLILANNKAPIPFVQGRVGFPDTVFVGRYNIMNFIPLFKLRVNPKFEICQATEKDIPEITELYKKFYYSYQLTPYFNKEKFLETIRNIKGLEIENFYFAKENGKIKAILACWDQSFYRRLFVQSFQMSAKILIFICKILSIFMKVPSIPKKKDHLKVMNIVMYAHDNSPNALKSLFRYTNNRLLGGKFPILAVFLKSESPFKKLLKGMIGVTVGTDCFVSTYDEKLKNTIQSIKESAHLEWQVFL